MAMIFHGGWGNINFKKTGATLKTKVDAKIEVLKRKQEERQERIRVICTNKGLNVSDLLQNLDAFNQNMSNQAFNMNVGEMEQLKSESRALRDEKSMLNKLLVMTRNLNAAEEYELTFDQLEYLDF
jgi:hypothetical protein